LLVTATPEDAAPAAAAHRDHLRELKDAGKLMTAGEFGNGDGYLDIFEASDRREAETIAHASPLIEGGLAAWLLREWTELDLG
jgi:uncharacterized protein YciI